MKDTITFNRAGLKEYKEQRDKAVESQSDSFVWKSSLQDVSHATKFIDKLESEFRKTTADSVTIPYEHD